MARTGLTGDQIVNDSLTSDDINESTFAISEVPFSDVNFSSLNLRDAVIEAKQGGIDPNPVDVINSGETLTINDKRQHIIVTEIVNSGIIIIYGTLGIL